MELAKALAKFPQPTTHKPSFLSDHPNRLGSPHYGIHDAREAHAWFIGLTREYEEFEVMTDRAGEWPVPFSSDTVRQVVVE